MELTAIWIWLAFGTSAITFLLHTFVGGPDVAKPLLESDMATVPKYTNYYCWHLVTLTLFAMAGSFLVAAVWPSAWELSLLATALAAGFAIWSVLLNIIAKTSFLKLPQWILFTPTSLFGILGML